MGKKIQHWHYLTVYLIIYDSIVVNVAYFGALWLRFDCRYSLIEPRYLDAFMHFAPFYTVFCIAVFWFLRLYKCVWRFASFVELQRTFIANLITFLAQVVCITFLYTRMPVSYYLFGAVAQFIMTLFARFFYRFFLLIEDTRRDVPLHNVMLIGAGNAGQAILKDVQKATQSQDQVVCIIDDNSNKWGRYIDGVQIAGGRESIAKCVKKYNIEKIYMALPSASTTDKREILNICNETPCELKSLPGMYQIYNGDLTIASMKPVDIEDLLGRDPVKADMEKVFQFITGKTIMVTGGGGSIGSELCRQIAGHDPKHLIIFDVYENGAYDVQQELKSTYPDLNMSVIIGSVRDSARMMQLFDEYRPQIVYHAAAHKHVPLMEDSPCEAIKNNVFGTYNTAYAAMTHGCERFVLISTDKAVNPTSIMGASKRLCEMIIQAFDSKIKSGDVKDIPRFSSFKDIVSEDSLMDIHTEFVAVRFGNVLGSNGSVVPLFKKQIEEGGPITVTHPDVIRYFMTIPEAVGLVLQAGTYARGGEIFVLDMGSQVKIADLARKLIKLSGLEPGEDIDIVYTGLRPGEKLYEEKLMAEEGLKKTENELIYIGCPIPFDTNEFFESLIAMNDLSNKNSNTIIYFVQSVVKTYHSPAESASFEIPNTACIGVTEAYACGGD